MALSEMGLQMDMARIAQQENSSANDRAQREHEMAQLKSDFQDVLETAKGSHESREALIRNNPDLVKKAGMFLLRNPSEAADALRKFSADPTNVSTTEQNTPQSLPGIIPRPAGGETSPAGQPTTPLTPEQQQRVLASIRTNPSTLENVPIQLVTPEVAQSPEYKAKIWKMIEDKKKEVESFLEPSMEQRYGKGFFGKIKKWFGESKYGAVANVGLKIVLGSIGAAGTLGSVVTGPFAAAILPFAATYGRKYLLEGIGEAVLLAKNWNKRSEMIQAIEKAKQEFDKGIKEIELGSLSPESAQLKLQQLIANRKNLELDAQRKRMEYYQAESKIKPWIQLASSAGAIGWSLMSGLSLGMQDYDKAVQVNPADHYQIAQGGHNVSWDPTQGLKWEEITNNGIVKHGFEWAKGAWSGAPWYTLGHGISPVDYIATYGGLMGTGGSMMVKVVKEFGGLKNRQADWEKKFYEQMAQEVSIKPVTAESNPSATPSSTLETPAQNTGVVAEIPQVGGPLPIKGSENGPEAVIPDLKKDNLEEGKIWKIGDVEIKETDGTVLPKNSLFRILSIEEDKAILLLVDKDNKPIPSGNKNQLFELDQKVLLENNGINPLVKPEKTAKEKAQEKLDNEEIDKYIKNMKFAKDKYLRTSGELKNLDNVSHNPGKGDYLITNVDENERCITLELDLGNNAKSDVRIGFKELFENKDNIMPFSLDRNREVRSTATGNENNVTNLEEEYIKANREKLKLPVELKKIGKGQVWLYNNHMFGVLGSNGAEVIIQEIDPNNNMRPVRPVGGGNSWMNVDVKTFLDSYKFFPDMFYSTEPKQKQEKQKQGNQQNS